MISTKVTCSFVRHTAIIQKQAMTLRNVRGALVLCSTDIRRCRVLANSYLLLAGSADLRGQWQR
jgi:hypothetical protein